MLCDQVVDEENGKPTRTLYKVLKQEVDKGCCRVSLVPFTGERRKDSTGSSSCDCSSSSKSVMHL